MSRAWATLAMLLVLSGCPKKNKPPPVERLFMGPHVTCAELTSGELRCQGRSADGQLGTGASGHGPYAVTASGKIVDVHLDETSTCVTEVTAKRSCFGRAEGERERTDAKGCQLTEGRVTCKGPSWSPPPMLDGLSNVVEIAEGRAHACARLSGGTVVCWGENTNAQLALPPPDRSNVPKPVQGLFGAAQIVAAGDGTCARLTDKSVKCWGSNDDERLSVGHGPVLNVPAPVHF